jgi:glutathione S-transferase
MKLHYHPVSTTSRVVTFFCADQGIPLDLVVVDLMTGEHVKEPYTSKVNPSKQVPVLEDEGFLLTECSSILKYIADKQGSATYPKDLKQRARVNEVMDWFNTNLYRDYGYHLVYPQVYDGHKRPPGDAQSGTIDWGKSKSEFWIGVLENHWLAGGKKFVAGDTLTLADYLGSTILSCGDLVGVTFAKFPNTDRWMKSMRARPGWSKTSEVHDGFAASLKGKPFEAIV